MQRRAAAVYFAFFLVVGAAAYAYIGYAQANQQPQFSVDGTTVAGGETVTIDGTEYSVGEVSHAGGGGGHGGGGGGLESEIAWTNESAQSTESVSNGSTITSGGTEYVVLVPQDANATSFTLRESLNVSGILAADDAVEDEVATYNGTDHVVFRNNESIRPLDEYLPEPETVEVSAGDTLDYDGQEVTVDAVGGGSVTFVWEASANRSEDLSEGGNVTLANGQQYFVHFPDDSSVTLASQSEYGAYATTVAERDYFHERMNGLWGIVILSGVAGVLLLGTAYLPVRG